MKPANSVLAPNVGRASRLPHERVSARPQAAEASAPGSSVHIPIVADLATSESPHP